MKFTKAQQLENQKFIDHQALLVQSYVETCESFNLSTLAKALNDEELSFEDFFAMTKYCAEKFNWIRNFTSRCAVVDLTSKIFCVQSVETGLMVVETAATLEEVEYKLKAIE